jgi:hypothetical protein
MPNNLPESVEHPGDFEFDALTGQERIYGGVGAVIVGTGAFAMSATVERPELLNIAFYVADGVAAGFVLGALASSIVRYRSEHKLWGAQAKEYARYVMSKDQPPA